MGVVTQFLSCQGGGVMFSHKEQVGFPVNETKYLECYINQNTILTRC